MDLRVGKKFRLKKKIGSGSFGEIYSAENVETGEDAAVKLESKYIRPSLMVNEKNVYKHLEGGSGLPTLYWSGQEGDYNVLVIELLGKSLEDLFVQCGRRFSLKTVLMIALQLLSRIEYIHDKGFLHRDIKPENFTIGVGKNACIIYSIDFGISSRYIDWKTKEHIEYRDGRNLTGTARYASVNTHLGIEPSRRDDLESIAYLLIYFLKGSLPWKSQKANTKREKYDAILNKKRNIPTVDLCSGLPNEFRYFLDEARRLDFTEKPHYALYREMFRNLFLREGYLYDYQYDWIQSDVQFIRKFSVSPRMGRKKPTSLQKTGFAIISDTPKQVRRVKMPQFMAPTVVSHTNAQKIVY